MFKKMGFDSFFFFSLQRENLKDKRQKREKERKRNEEECGRWRPCKMEEVEAEEWSPF